MSRRRIFVVAGTAVLILAAVVAARLSRSAVSAMTEGGSAVPTARVQRGSLDLVVYLDGDLRPSRQVTIAAPTVGGALRILSMVETGDAVSEGEVILEFDPADQLFALEQAKSELEESEQEIVKRRADTQAQEAQDNVALLTAQFDVRRAELDAAVDEDLIPSNEYKIRQVTLEEARRTLAQTEQDVMARETTSRAALAVLEEGRTKTRLAAERAQQNMETLIVRAPIDGVVSLRDNLDASGGLLFVGMSLPPYRVGDTVNPGRALIDLADLSQMDIRATVNEQERANLSSGQPATIESAALPGMPLPATVTAVSGLGRAVRNAGPLRQFEVTLTLDQPDPRLRPGTVVDVVVRGETVDDVLLLPRQAVFEREGKPVLFLRTGDGFEPVEIKVLHRTESRVAIEGVAGTEDAAAVGVDEGAEVALVAPVTGASTSAPAAGPALGP